MQSPCQKTTGPFYLYPSIQTTQDGSFEAENVY